MATIKPVTNLFLFLMPFVIALQSCGSSEAKIEKIKTGTAAPAMEAFYLQKGSLSSSIRIPGELMAYQHVDLYAKVNSFVKKVYVDVGSEVKAGQLLATMEAPEINSQLSAARSRLKSQEALYLASKATYNRLYETSKTPGTISPNDLDIANAKQKSDLAQLEAARAAYNEIANTRNYLQIRAPFNGVITARNVSAGAYVGPSGKGSDLPLFTLQEQKKLRLVTSVPEAYVSYLHSQSQVTFTVKALANQTFTAKVLRLAGALDSRLRAQRTEMDVINTDKKLLPGMVAEVSLPLNGNTSAFVVPASAILNSTEGVYVIKVQDGKTVWVPVTTGRNDGDKTEIFGELTEKDVVITNASEEIRNGEKAPNIKVQ